jgi:hypothetical protein
MSCWFPLLCPSWFLGTLAGKSEPFVKNSDHFVQFMKHLNVQSVDPLVISDVSHFANVPVGKALQVISNKLQIDDDRWTECPAGWSHNLTVWGLFENHIFSTYFQQKEGMGKGSSLSAVVSNIYLEHFENLTPDSAQCNHCCYRISSAI